MRCAVKVPGLSTIYFLKEIPAERDGLVIEEGAWIEVPPDVVDWPDGADRPPSPTLGVSRSNPGHYRMFKRPEEVEAAGFEPTGMSYGGHYSPSHWERLARAIPAMKAFDAIKGNDRPGAMDEAMRYIREAR